MIFKIRLIDKIYLFLIIGVIFSSCVKNDDFEVEGLAPVYISPTDFTQIKSLTPRAFENLGNIVNVGDYIFIVEKNKGIHVIDNVDPENPVKLFFWQIPGCTEFTIEKDVLYADNSFHLLVIDISDYSDIKVVNYIKDTYSDKEVIEVRPPEPYVGYFICADKDKGIFTKWETRLLINPLCEAY